MVKSVLGVHHQGLRDWIIQRLSAIIMAAYSFFLILYFLTSSNLTFADWHYLFAHPFMKIATLLFLISLLYHAWIGIWTVFTDYVKPFVIRAVLNVLVLILLFSWFFWALMIIWSV